MLLLHSYLLRPYLRVTSHPPGLPIPPPSQVAAEVHAWKVQRQHALMDIARHIADGVFKDCVDEIILEARFKPGFCCHLI